MIMQLREEELLSFRALYKEKFNVEISDVEALKEGLKLINLMKNILFPNLKLGKK